MEEKDTEGLERGLTSSDEEVRLAAVREAGAAREDRFLDLLVEAMGDPSWRVRKEAAEGIIGLGRPGAVGLLLARLREPGNVGRRNSIVETVIRIGRVAVPETAGLLADPDPDVRKFAVDILGGIEAPESVPPLMKALHDANENVVATAAEYLGLKGDRQALGPLFALLDTGSFWTRFCALRAIGQMAGNGQEEGVLRYLDNEPLRSEVIDVLARIGGERSFGRLLEGFSRSAARDRGRILTALAEILGRVAGESDERAGSLAGGILNAGLGEPFSEHLRGKIGRSPGEERRRLFRVASFFPSREMMETLVSVIEESEEEDREEICRSLARFPEEYLPNLYRFLSSEATLIRRKVAWIFGHRRFKDALPKILPLVGDEDGHVRASVARALGNIGDKSAVVPLCALLGDPYPDVREAAVDALTEMAAADPAVRVMVKEIIVSALSTERETVVEGSLAALGKMRDAALIPVFARFLKDARVRVRKAALAGLGRIGGAQATTIVLSALGDENAGVRIEAIRFLGQAGDRKHDEVIIGMVGDEDDAVAAEALRFLGSAGDRHRDAIERAARESGGLKQLAAVRALCAIGGETVMNSLPQLLVAAGPEGKKEILSFLGKSGDGRAIPIILASLDDPDWSVRLAVVDAVRRNGDRSAAALVRERHYPGEKDFLVRRAMESLPPAE
jgi:HEAT repeat protein